MSFIDRIKSLFGGSAGDDRHDHVHHAHDDHVGHSHDEPVPAESNLSASLGTPGPAPVDPLGTTPPMAAPEAGDPAMGPDPTATPDPAYGTDPAARRDDEV